MEQPTIVDDQSSISLCNFIEEWNFSKIPQIPYQILDNSNLEIDAATNIGFTDNEEIFLSQIANEILYITKIHIPLMHLTIQISIKWGEATKDKQELRFDTNFRSQFLCDIIHHYTQLAKNK